MKFQNFKFINTNWAIFIALAVAIIGIGIAVFYAGQPLLEFFGFRQTQTALTSFWMLKEGWELAYQTPVAGYPWSIPFEFPIYQSIVAFIVWALNVPLDSTGRILSFCFLLACGWPAFQMAKRLHLSDCAPWVFCALLWSSPIYLFWGRTFMIETAALFFIFAAMPYALDLRNLKPRLRSVILFIFFATLAMLQKATTALPVLMVMAVLLLIIYVKDNGLRIPPWRYIVCVMVSFAVPIFIGVLWVLYTDMVKELNIFGLYLTSDSLFAWNWGTYAQRLDFSIWKTILWNRVFLNNAAGWFGVLLLGYAIFRGKKQTRTLILISLLLFILPVCLFINLHQVHDYYQVVNVLFLTSALTIAIISLPKLFGRNVLVPTVTIFFVISNFYFFSVGYATNLKMKIPADNTLLAMSAAIKQYTPKDSAIVVFGLDWSSELAYYSERKAFTVPGWIPEYDAVWQAPIAFIGDKKLGALVLCEAGDKPNLEQIMTHPITKQNTKFLKIDHCYLWFPEAIDS
ncbi:MAG: hypothetical protein WC748_00985 [Legionellales bacterium]|jgi:hypothetical protein